MHTLSLPWFPFVLLDTLEWSKERSFPLPAPVTAKVSFMCTRALETDCCSQCLLAVCGMQSRAFLTLSFLFQICKTQTFASQEVDLFLVWLSLEFSADCETVLLSLAINTRLAVCIHWDSLCFWRWLFVFSLEFVFSLGGDNGRCEYFLWFECLCVL